MANDRAAADCPGRRQGPSAVTTNADSLLGPLLASAMGTQSQTPEPAAPGTTLRVGTRTAKKLLGAGTVGTGTEQELSEGAGASDRKMDEGDMAKLKQLKTYFDQARLA
jgi:hypothetical protein